ncbi:hypothetical protein V6x_18560 [Gimesia chilikensis]|uniref:Uncharacterized protein n=1 Tax=Gimesia chilikensis TaxID=2605989 RepID=A0A517PL49_9PLAN|nr:hypothetical protein HG66A1_18820 [Gimesia chilikensis]QDT84105.1 hypothetical protein MalM14_17570 [Gimesia chilikensis]QDT84107.1 hypothetical protein MalM14_17590 [Gimesia chilikensis]QDU02155.1 hypothetical protein V6x_18560 [Gimesia chilikensis]
MNSLVSLVQMTAVITAGVLLLACLAGAVRYQSRRK